MWRPSPSPEESWSDASGANEDGEWPVEAIVGEEIRLDGTSRYEVRWRNWHRRDGSNTTWETERFERTDLIRKWNRMQKRLRCTRADVDLDMNVAWPDDAVHKRLTDHRRQAYDEKLERKRRVGSTSAANWDAEIEASYGRSQASERGDANSKLRVRRLNPTSTPGPSMSVPAQPTPPRRSKIPPQGLTPLSLDRSVSVLLPKKSRPQVNIAPISSPGSAVATSSISMRKGKATLMPSSAGSSREPETQSALPSVIVSQPTLRGRISSAWNKAAKEAMAATVRISPDISDDVLPRNLRKFRYLEKGYVFCDDDLQEIFNVASGCSCRNLSEIYDLQDGINTPAYSKGLFTFEIPRGVDVIECNKYCECSPQCRNRVAQHPRSIGLEIFDTDRYGLGVRTLDDVPQGKVLGTYTGMLIRREQVEEMPKEHHGYMFDLDSTEVRNSENLGGKYTVDSYEYGNWTRFVNHSCGPNMEIYCVVYDTIPYVNMPYVAFVASTDIAAGTELTIDYHPHTEENRKGKQRASGAKCRCGSAMCRGWFGV